MPPIVNARDELSHLAIQLLKGPLYRDAHDKLWPGLLQARARVADYVSVIGLRLEIDEADGFAFLRSAHDDEVEAEFPRLVSRHSLGFHVSLLLALLRKRLAEFDSSSSDARLVVSFDQVVEMMRVHLPDSADDVKVRKAVETHLNKVQSFGFVQRLRGSDDQFEVRRIIRAFVDGQWLADFDRRLADYVEQAAGRSSTDRRSPDSSDPGDD